LRYFAYFVFKLIQTKAAIRKK